MDNKSKKPTISVKRRRPGSSTPSKPRERAEAPSRERDRTPTTGSVGGTGSTSGTGYTGGTPSGGFSLPGGSKLLRSPIGIGIVVLVMLCCLGIYMLTGGGISLDDLGGGQDYSQPVEQPLAVDQIEPTRTSRPTLPPAVAGDGGTWTVMLYQDADDKVLEKDIFVDLNEAERVGSGPNLNIVAQLDRYQGGFSGDGNWTSARRYFVRQDDDLNAIGSDLVMDLGEVNMASGDTLVDFATWAIANYPADKYMLILSDHGVGWPGGWSDASASGRGGQLPLQQVMGEQLYLNELGQGLEEIHRVTGVDKFEVIGMDACLMGHIEVMSALAPYARYAVFSQEVEPALGWAYASFLDALQNNPGLSGAHVGQLIVDSYIVDDQRIVDDAARADLVGRGSPFGSLYGTPSLPSADQVARQMTLNVTLTAVDLQTLPVLTGSLNQLAFAMQAVNQRGVAQARSYAQSFTSIFGREVPPSYIDLGNFAAMVAKASNDSGVSAATSQLHSAMQQVIVAEKHGARVAGATGISIYFPNSQLYGSSAGPVSYTGIADRFAYESLWDEFLAFHYTGKNFSADQVAAAVPPAGTALRAPAAGGIQVSAISASGTEVMPGQTVRLRMDIEGENIGYVKLLVGYFDQNANSIYVADSDYLASSDTREAGGVYYPDWGVDAFTIEFDWEPIVYAVDDGSSRYPALFTPESYGASSEQAVYSVEGVYTYADSGEQRKARLFFVDGVLQQVYGFTGEDEASAPREILPQPGDMFTLLEKWMDLDDQGQVVSTAYQVSDTLIFSDRMFTWEVLDAAAGQYVVGFIIEDLDGNSQVVFKPITVR